MLTTPNALRTRITIFGRRNAGKSSLINALTQQPLAIVSPEAGTTTDPVAKAMELPPLGPVLLTDTAGLDDTGDLGRLRVEKTLAMLPTTDIALLLVDACLGWTEVEAKIYAAINQAQLPCVIVINKWDLAQPTIPEQNCPCIKVSANTGYRIEELKNLLANLKPEQKNKPLVRDLLQPEDVVILVVPVDAEAPKGRLILPQQQVIRDILDQGAVALVTQPEQLLATLDKLTAPPKLVITDSQVFGKVNQILPRTIPLTSFSILFARYKGDLWSTVQGAQVLDNIKDNDEILIAEGCTHHVQCGDIGREKIPNWIKKHTGTEPHFTFTAGGDFPTDLSKYKLIIHCGGCMLTAKEMQHRYRLAQSQGVPITNYGVAIAHLQGILTRVTEIFH